MGVVREFIKKKKKSMEQNLHPKKNSQYNGEKHSSNYEATTKFSQMAFLVSLYCALDESTVLYCSFGAGSSHSALKCANERNHPPSGLGRLSQSGKSVNLIPQLPLAKPFYNTHVDYHSATF